MPPSQHTVKDLARGATDHARDTVLRLARDAFEGMSKGELQEAYGRAIGSNNKAKAAEIRKEQERRASGVVRPSTPREPTKEPKRNKVTSALLRGRHDEWPKDGTDDDAGDPFTYSCTEDPASGVKVVKRSDGKNISFQRAEASTVEEALRKAKEVWKLQANGARDTVRRLAAKDAISVQRQGDQWKLTGTDNAGNEVNFALDVEDFPTKEDALAEARERERGLDKARDVASKDSARDAVRRLASSR